jgi:hypothetical protein
MKGILITPDHRSVQGAGDRENIAAQVLDCKAVEEIDRRWCR